MATPKKAPAEKLWFQQRRIDPQEFMRKTGRHIGEMRRTNNILAKQGELIMANLQEVQADLEGLKSDIAAERAEVQTNAADVKTKLDTALAKIDELMAAGAGAATSADLDALRVSISEARSGVVAISDAVPSGPVA